MIFADQMSFLYRSILISAYVFHFYKLYHTNYSISLKNAGMEIIRGGLKSNLLIILLEKFQIINFFDHKLVAGKEGSS